MGTTQHTPGPWRVVGRDVKHLPHSLVAGDTLLARVYSRAHGDVAEEEANACLIAAAPELLAALKETLEDCIGWYDDATGGKPDEREIVQRARAAIAKAEGL